MESRRPYGRLYYACRWQTAFCSAIWKRDWASQCFCLTFRTRERTSTWIVGSVRCLKDYEHQGRNRIKTSTRVDDFRDKGQAICAKCKVQSGSIPHTENLWRWDQGTFVANLSRKAPPKPARVLRPILWTVGKKDQKPIYRHYKLQQSAGMHHVPVTKLQHDSKLPETLDSFPRAWLILFLRLRSRKFTLSVARPRPKPIGPNHNRYES